MDTADDQVTVQQIKDEVAKIVVAATTSLLEEMENLKEQMDMLDKKIDILLSRE